MLQKGFKEGQTGIIKIDDKDPEVLKVNNMPYLVVMKSQLVCIFLFFVFCTAK